MIRNIIAISFGTKPLIKIYTGIPIMAARVKPISCLCVRFNATLVFTLFKSFGIGTYAISYLQSPSIFLILDICSYTLNF